MRSFLLILTSMFSLASVAHTQCVCTNCPVTIPNNSVGTSNLDIGGLTNDQLGISGQDVCEVDILLDSDAIEELDLSLTSPSGDEILLIERTFGSGINQNLTFDITFVSCNVTAQPDPGYPAVFDPTAYNFASNQTFTGTYYPSDGQCLEDLTGCANGTYTLRGQDYVVGDPHTVQNWELIFCSSAGLACNTLGACNSCDPGDLSTVGPIMVTECEGSSSLLFNNLTPSFIGPPPSSDYGVTYFVSDFSTGIVIERNDIIDLTSTPPGTYRICGLSYLLTDIGSLPPITGGYTIPDVQQDIVNDVFCGDLSDNCTLVTISPDLPAPNINWPTTMCVGTTYRVPITSYDPSLSYTLATTSGAFSTLFFDAATGEIVINPFSDIFDINICVSIAEDCDNSQSCATINVLPVAATPILDGPLGVCTGDGGTVTVTNAQPGDNYTWSITGPGSITANNNDDVDFTTSGSGQITICADLTNGCGTSQGCITIIVTDPAPPSTNAQATYCLPNGFFAGNPNGGSTSMLWEQISGPGTITFFNATIVATSWTADLPGTYVVRLTKENNGCITFDEATIELLLASVPPTLTGPFTFCDNVISNVAITNPDPNTTYVWSTVGPGVITADNGDNVDVEVTGNGNLQVCVDATNQCGTTSVCWTADATIPIPATANAAASYCMPGGTFFGSTNGSSNQIEYSQISGPGTITFANQFAVQTDWTVDIPGTYTLELFKNFNDCDTVEIFTFDVIDTPTATEVVTCSNGEFTIEITFSGGTAPYSVFGTTISGNVYTSPPYPSGSAVSTPYEDANGCGDNLLVQEFCPCVTDAGNVPAGPITLCSDQLASTIVSGTTLDINDIGVYILHDAAGNTLGTILDQNTTGSFGLLVGMNVEQSYYISYVVGNDDGTGNVDLGDPCLSVAPGTEVIWIDYPTLDLGPDLNNCTGSEVITAITDPTATVTWSYNPTSPVQDADLDGSTPGVLLFDNGSEGIHLIDATSTVNGCATTTTISIEILPQGQLINVSENCQGQDYTVSFDIVGGTAPYLVDGVIITGSQFESAAIASGDSYSLEVIDDNGCLIADISGSRNCDCTTDAGTLTSVVLDFCGTQDTVRLTPDGDATLDSDDLGTFVLHDGSPTVLGSVLSQNSNGIFVFEPPLMIDSTYYITYVVGSGDGNGAVDLSDPCLDFTIGVPVTWYDDYDVLYADSIVQCFNTLLLTNQEQIPNVTTEVRLLSGPGTITLTRDDSLGLEFTFDETGIYLIETRNSRNACLDIDTINLTILEPLDFSIYQDLEVCRNSVTLPSILRGQRLDFTSTNPAFTITEVGDSIEISSPTADVATIIMEGPSFFCNDVDSFQLSITPELEIAGISFDCSSDGSNATVEVILAGGDGSYTINGIISNSDTVTLDNVNPSLPYVISAESGICPAVIDTITINCGCSNSPANLSSDLIQLCPGEDITTTFVDEGQLGPDDSRLIILHDGDGVQIGNILGIEASPVFALDPSTTYPDTLWLTPYIGPTDVGGTPLLGDSCAVLGVAQPVVILPPATISLDGPLEICLGETGNLSITPSGMFPFNIEVSINGQTSAYTLTDDQVLDIPVLATDSTGLNITVTLIDYPCPTLPSSLSIDVAPCDCVTYQYTVPDGICNSGQAIDLSTWESNERPANYIISRGDVSLSGSSITIASTYQGIVEVQAVADLADACDTVYNLTFNVEQARELILTDSNLVVCPSDSRLINLDLFVFTATPIGTWSPSTTINTEDILAGTTTATYTIPAGDYCPSTSADFTITKTPPLDYIITSTDPDCAEALGSIGVTITDSTLLSSITLDGSAVTQDDLDGLVPGSYQISLADINNCIYDEDVEITDISPIDVSIVDEANGEDGAGFVVRSQVVGGTGSYLYQWIVAGDTIAAETDLITIQIDDNTEVQLIVTDDNGCSAEDIILLRITSEPINWVMPNVFNPNSATNGVITIPSNADIVQVLDWKIYDRWGNLVFNALPYDPAITQVGWSGDYQGTSVSNGVYVYYIRYETRSGSIEQMGGDIAVLR